MDADRTDRSVFIGVHPWFKLSNHELTPMDTNLGDDQPIVI
jgi:hypothetical protein